MDFAIPADHRVKIKKKAKKDPTRELRKLSTIKVTEILIAISALVMVSKGLEKGLEELETGGRIEVIESTALLRST